MRVSFFCFAVSCFSLPAIAYAENLHSLEHHAILRAAEIVCDQPIHPLYVELAIERNGVRTRTELDQLAREDTFRELATYEALPEAMQRQYCPANKRAYDAIEERSRYWEGLIEGSGLPRKRAIRLMLGME